MPWIGIFLVSTAWLGCHAYPDSGAFEISDRPIERSDTSFANSEKGVTTFDLPHRLDIVDEPSLHDAWHTAKQHVSIPVRNLKVVETRKLHDNFSIGDDSHE